jgi:hypothetical protein
MANTDLTLAKEAFSARNDWKDNDSVSFLNTFRFWANLIHNSNRFVAHDIAFLHG